MVTTPKNKQFNTHIVKITNDIQSRGYKSITNMARLKEGNLPCCRQSTNTTLTPQMQAKVDNIIDLILLGSHQFEVGPVAPLMHVPLGPNASTGDPQAGSHRCAPQGSVMRIIAVAMTP